MEYYLSIAVAIFAVLLTQILWQVFVALVWRPYALTKFYRKQGITGPPYRILSGSLHEIKKLKKAARETVFDINSHDITPRILPHYNKWASQYGENFLYWYGTEARICITDPELAKRVLSNKFGFYEKPPTRPMLLTMAGKGLVFVEGSDWVRHRRILNPAFNMDKLKVMVDKMATCTLPMLDQWRSFASSKLEIEMNREFQKLTADIIAHTAFGSSYSHGKEAFEAQRELQKLCAASMADIFIPGTQYLPTPSNIRILKLDRRLRNSLRRIIESRIMSHSSSNGDDLLGIMVSSATESTNLKMRTDEILEECKTFFFAGHETTSNLLTWAVFLLSLHPEWQERLRHEVLQECGDTQVPHADMLSKLKLLNMVVLETLRLYSPAIGSLREALEDMKVGDFKIKKGTTLSLSFARIHRSKAYWGEDANEFNPWRFKDGVIKAAKHPNAMLAFSVGPRACIGQNFAMLEAKLVLALILQRFALTLSSGYKHAPVDNLTLQPQYGLPVVVTPLSHLPKVVPSENETK